MAELIDDVRGLLAPWPTANSLASALRFKSAEEASISAQLAVPLLIAGMAKRLNDPTAAKSLIDLLPSIDIDALTDLEATFAERHFEPIGTGAIAQALPGRHRLAADAVAEEVGCAPRTAHDVFSPIAWLLLAVIVDRHGALHNRHTLLTVVEAEESALHEAGWGEWMLAVSADSDADAAATGDAGTEAPPATSSQFLRSEREAQPKTPNPARYPPPVSRASRQASATKTPNADGVEQPAYRQPERRSAAVRTREPDGEIEEVRTLSRHEGSSNRGLVLLGVMMIIGLSGALIWYLNNSVGESAADTRQTSADAGSTTSSPDGAESVEPLTVVLSDKTGLSPDLAATASLRLDVDGGRVCYQIEAVGFDDGAAGQISHGEEGVQGRMIVDLGPLGESSSGCAIADPLRVKAVLDDPVGHYLLLSNLERTLSVSGKLAGSELVDKAPVTLTYDPDGGGASVSVDDGRFILQGEVPDADTANLLLAEFERAEIGPTDIDNQLEVVAGAAGPSGRIVLQNDLLFAIGSTDLADEESASLAVLAELFVGRPDWQISVIGHTDNSGDPALNLALSQERSEAVRTRLMSLGVSDFSLEANGVGETDPVEDNSTLEGRQANRRIEFQVQPRSG